jgi:hypothetical protein
MLVPKGSSVATPSVFAQAPDRYIVFLSEALGGGSR